MLSLNQLKELLVLNEMLTRQAIENNLSHRRLQELALHKSIIKDEIIVILQDMVNRLEYKQLSKGA